MEKNYSRREFLDVAKKAGLVILASSPISCALRPFAKGGPNYDIDTDLALGNISEENSKYYVKGVTIFNEPFYHVTTPIGDALFKDKKSLESTVYKIGPKGKITGTTSIQSGEGGLFFIDPVLNYNGERVKEIAIDPRFYKADVKGPNIFEKSGDWGLFDRTEEGTKFNFGLGYMSERKPLLKDSCTSINPYIAIKVKDIKIDKNEKKFYNFYLVSVDGAELQIERGTGNIKIFNPREINRPKFIPWEKMNYYINKIANEKNLSNEERELTENTFKEVGLKELYTK